MKVFIRPSTSADIKAIENLHKKAFGDKEGDHVASFTKDLLADETAHPLFSLVAKLDHTLIGHILFTKAHMAITNQRQ